jgi:CRP/FNR family cyclic AMP-dependent transcriptional regulator
MLLRRRSQKVDVLKSVPLFGALSRRHLDAVAREADEVQVDAGRVLTRQGTHGREFLLILEGGARVERDGKVIARLGRGDFIGEMSIIDGKPRSATVIADSPTALLVVERRCFAALLDTVPGLQKEILVSLCERLRAADDALASTN